MIGVAAASFAAGLAPFVRDELRPILDLAAAGRCGLGLQAQSRLPFEAPPTGRVFVNLVADRSASGSRGPAGFHGVSMTALLRSGPYIAIVSGEADHVLYAEAAAVAEGAHTAIIVETDPQHRRAWRTFIEAVAPGRLRWSGDAEAGEGLY